MLTAPQIDDFVGKRYGAGEAWYGKKKSDLSDDEVIEIENKQMPRKEVSDDELKTNAVLIVGDVKSLGAIGDWVGFDLAAKGFNIRVGNIEYLNTMLALMYLQNSP